MADKKAWTCKIGYRVEGQLPEGSDGPMRKAVEQAYRDLTGMDPDITETGWGTEQPNLGLATTEQLLTELSVRVQIHFEPSSRREDIAAQLETIIRRLVPSELQYRTVDS